MHLHEHHTLPNEDQVTLSDEWFDSQFREFSSCNSDFLRGCLDEEIQVLKAFHNVKLTAKEAAHAITRPISTSPIPSLGTYSDDCYALADLWRVLIKALIEWPLVRLPDLLELLEAIGKIPDEVHLGQLTDDDDEQPLTWAVYPYFGMAWYDFTLEPGEIVRRALNAAAEEICREHYIKKKDIEAQLWARHILRQKPHRTLEDIINALEGTPDESVATDNAMAFEQVRLEYHVPAVRSWMRHAGPQILTHVAQQDGGMQRWMRWEERLQDIAEQVSDERTKAAAVSAFEDMKAARAIPDRHTP